MRVRKLSRRSQMLRATRMTAVLGIACIALLTCTPPNFGPPDTGEPLTIAPRQPEVLAGMSLYFTAAGGAGTIAYHADEGTITQAGRYTAPTYPPADDFATVWVTDAAGHTAETTVKIIPRPLLLTPSSASIFENSKITITASGGKPTYTLTEPGAGTLTKIVGTNSWTFESASAYLATITLTDVSDPPLDPAIALINVQEAPAELSISPGTVTLWVGDELTFAAAGGSEPYHYTMDSGVNSVTSGGIYQADHRTPVGVPDVVMVTDESTPTPQTDTADVTVIYHPLQINPPSINLEFNKGQDFGATGGNAEYRFTMVSGYEGLGVVDLYSGVFTAPSVVGITKVQVNDTASSTPSVAEINVYAPLIISPELPSVNAGGPVLFTASGGVKGPGYTFSIEPEDFGVIVPSTGAYTAPGMSGTAVVKVTDSIGNLDWTIVTVVDPAQWGERQKVDSFGTNQTGEWASLALDASGNPQIVYWEDKSDELRRAKGTGFSTISTVDDTSSSDRYASLALYSGNARVAWYDAATSKKNLMYAAENGSTWDITTVDSTGDVGKFASLALDSTGNPHIAYYDATNLRLKYAKWVGPLPTNWAIETVPDSSGNVGQYASLALDDSGKPHIAYYDATGKDLKYAWYDSSWHIESVDTTGDVGQYASLKLTTSGYPCIAYYDATIFPTANKDLKYAWYDSGWHIESVDTTGDVGKFASLALDGSSNPRIAYYNATSLDLKYASRVGTIWVVGTVDGVGNVGQYASLALAPSFPYPMRIAYYDSSAHDLYYIEEE
jgi:hypothetical protein